MDKSFLKNARYFNIENGLNLLRRGGCVVMSWGVSLITPLNVGKEPKGMSFNVNGYKFVGTVILSVNGADYYEVRFMQEGKILDHMTLTDLYVDDVITLIDEVVEKQPEYVR